MSVEHALAKIYSEDWGSCYEFRLVGHRRRAEKRVRLFSPVFNVIRETFQAISLGSNNYIPKHFIERIKLKAYIVENDGVLLMCKLFRN